ncbi:response regulator receiver [Methanosarcina siciliae C2J]|uniref:Response regulator receiver n=3 Tax=Methanosarcina siciliae TaxID=38027 RepID=A0A0E3PEK1_9EURY|nr:response regulator [Methanosarcina siciliae]AKB28749.1 response regulator receiver [Methanosarcina siciliae T4/M]AKB32675.1 response regulator receiver [Methanosarcina siciliae HI350]AKB36974.1 response regulator receiver [Methanosarcina siciliae C2J]
MAEGRILIVEDEHIVAMGIKRMLKSLGYTLAGVASSGEDAISKTESTFPDLVLMDIMLKGDMNGIEAAKEIKARFDVPVIYLTACSESKIVERAWKTGPLGYIVKPFDEKDLQKSIDVALRRHRMEKNELEKGSEKAVKSSEKCGKSSRKYLESVKRTEPVECAESLQNLK